MAFGSRLSQAQDEAPVRRVGSAVEPGDADLVAAALADPEAFALLYERYLTPVYQYCYVRLGNREAAEDATSQVFCKALAALAGYRGNSFRSWLFAIAHNVVIDAFRRRAPHQPLEVVDGLADQAATPEEMALAGEARRSLWALLPELPADQRRVVELRLAGLTGAEVARVLGRSLGAVKMLQLRAVAKLRVLFGVEPDLAPAREDGNG